MLMLSVIFLPFGVTDRLSFLSNSAISLMFNSGAKMMVICFLQVMIAKILGAYFTNLGVSPFANLSTLVQMTVMCIFFAYITKKIPDLVSSFLNGSPALSGGGMIQQAKSSASQVAAVVAGIGTGVGAISGASAAATAKAGSGLSGKMSTLPGMKGKVGHAIDTLGVLARSGAQHALAGNPLVQGYARGQKAVLGENGDLQSSNVGFLQGVRRLAGMETDKGYAYTSPRADVAKNDGANPVDPKEQKKSANGNEQDAGNGHDQTRVSNLKDLQNMSQEQRQQAISSMSNQSLQQLAKNVKANDTQSLTQEQQQQLKNFKSQKDVDSMTKEQRQTLNSIFEELGKPPKT